MGAFYESIIRPMLFRGDAEEVHEQALGHLRTLAGLGPVLGLMEKYNKPTRGGPTELFGLTFPNPVGLAAGFDKNAECWRAMAALGFGHVEIGTVTSQEQPGNPKPRIFRLPEHEALINRMGFPNEGAEAVAKRLAESAGQPRKIPLGVNIGKSRVTPIEEAVDDYLASYNLLADHADYFTINVSSPNTPDLRQLQQKDHLAQLVTALIEADSARAERLGKGEIPILVKIAPDLSFRELDDILECSIDAGVKGVVASNTLAGRPIELGEKDETGGLSGAPIHPRSLDMVNYIHRAAGAKLPIIGVGGVMSERTAGDMFDAGAQLIQIYTGLVYRGPFFAKRLAQALSWRTDDWVR